MRPFAWQWLAISSLLVGTLASAETRPQYGGTLHVTMRVAPSSLDPADKSQPDCFARRNITTLIFDTLVTTDDSGRAEAALATAWEASQANQRLQLRLRRGVKFHDGTPLTPEAVAASLRLANASWNVRSEGDSVIIEGGFSNSQLLEELALPRNAIAKRDGERVSGTGPFHIMDWQPGKKLILAAEEDYWRGRPFLGGIEIEMGRSLRDQMTSLELGRAELVEVAPEQMHRVSPERFRLTHSSAIELLALIFTRDVASPDDKTLRDALRFSVERGSMHSVLLQGAGQPTAGILPAWMSGYGFVFSTAADLARARQLHDQVRAIPTWTLGYDGGDPLARFLAERVALNAKDAGLPLQPTPAATADLRLVRIPLASSDPWIALQDLSAQVNLPFAPGKGRGAEDLYAAEQAALASGRAIPLFHLPASFASASNVRGWVVRNDGSLDLANAWVKVTLP
jgi:ABC-type transport system substrate-binding protein